MKKISEIWWGRKNLEESGCKFDEVLTNMPIFCEIYMQSHQGLLIILQNFIKY